VPTKIEWATDVWNPTSGCTKVSQGCKNCYAARMAKRLAGRAGYPRDEPFRLTLHPDRLLLPLHWTKPRRVFVDSMSDLFHLDVPDEYICAVWGAMAAAPQHTFQVLTKRPARMAAWFESLERRSTALGNVFPEDGQEWRRRHILRAALLRQTGEGTILGIPDDPRWPLPNVWIGTSVEDQSAANTRIPHLLNCPAEVRFLSCEPLLGPVDLAEFLGPEASEAMTPPGARCGHHGVLLRGRPCPDCFPDIIDWVIVGGESGPGSRPMHPDWVRDIRRQCSSSRTPFFFKQWGEYVQPSQLAASNPEAALNICPERRAFVGSGFNEIRVYRVGKKAAGALLDGRQWHEMPTSAVPADV